MADRKSGQIRREQLERAEGENGWSIRKRAQFAGAKAALETDIESRRSRGERLRRTEDGQEESTNSPVNLWKDEKINYDYVSLFLLFCFKLRVVPVALSRGQKTSLGTAQPQFKRHFGAAPFSAGDLTCSL